MNKYALATVLGTYLLGFAKSKLGSGIRIKSGYKECHRGYVDFDLNDLSLQNNQNTLSRIREVVESYEAIVMNIEFEEIQNDFDEEYEEIQNDFDEEYTYSFTVNISKNYYSENEPDSVDNANKFSTLLQKLKEDIASIIGPESDWRYLIDDDRVYSGVGLDLITGYPYIQNQSGEWLPYKHPNKASKLRKR